MGFMSTRKFFERFSESKKILRLLDYQKEYSSQGSFEGKLFELGSYYLFGDSASSGSVVPFSERKKDVSVFCGCEICYVPRDLAEVVDFAFRTSDCRRSGEGEGR